MYKYLYLNIPIFNLAKTTKYEYFDSSNIYRYVQYNSN